MKSIKSTRQITRAMELVSAAKMQKAVDRAMSTRPYASLSWDIIHEIARRTRRRNPLLRQRHEVKKIGLILITSNRGLAGSFNEMIIRASREYMLHHKEKVNIEADLVIMGRKGREAMFRHGHVVVAEFAKLDADERVEEVRPLARLVVDEYIKGTYDRIVLAYMEYVSALVQKPTLRQLLPLAGRDPYLEPGEETHEAEFVGDDDEMHGESEEEDDGWYLFEPSPDEVMGALLPRIVEVQLYQAILSSNASEHSARMLAMRNATDAAGEMLAELDLMYNQSRQANITQEIAEIVGGRAALKR